MNTDWNSKLLSLTSEQFEELCFDLITTMEFVNRDLRKGGRDKGRDIYAEFMRVQPNGKTVTPEKWFFQCKRYKGGISFDKISSAFDWAITDKADYFVIMSNSYLTLDCKEQLEKRSIQQKIKCFEWTNKKFQELLLRQPRVLEVWFPNEKFPEAKERIKPHTIFEFELKIPDKFKGEFINLMKLDGKERDNGISELIRDKILTASEIDANIKAIIYQHLSLMAYLNGDIPEAIQSLDRALQITPQNRNVLLNKGLFLEKIKKYDEATKCYDKILNEINNKDKTAWNNKGHNLSKLGRYPASKICFKKAIEIDPTFILSRDNLGAIYVETREYSKAFNIFNETLDLFPNSKTTLNKKAMLLKEMRNFAEAYKIINMALEIDPNYVEALNNKGVILEHNGQYQHPEKYHNLALEIFERVIELDSDFVLGYTNKVTCLINLKKYDDALRYIDDVVLKKFPHEALPWSKKGTILINLSKLKDATICVNKALIINPRSVDALIIKGEIYLKENKFKKALRTFEDIIKLSPQEARKEAVVWEFKGRAFEGLGKKERAKRCYKKADALIKPKSLIE